MLWFNIVHHSSLFQYFWLIYSCPYSSSNIRHRCVSIKLTSTEWVWIWPCVQSDTRHNDMCYQLLVDTSQKQVLVLLVRLLLTVILCLTLYWGQSEHLDDQLLVTIEQHKIHPFQLFSCQPSIPNSEQINKSFTWVEMLVA